MIVLGIPVAKINLGSTRTRYHYMMKYLPKGWKHKRYKPGAKGDVLYIQKTETAEVWKAVKDCKKRGIPIVYERDDFCKPWNKAHTKIMNASDACTTITQGLLDHVKHHTTTPMYHVFDGIDYEISKDERVELRDRISKVATYGRHANIEAAVSFYKKLNIKKAYFCNKPIHQMDAKYIEWKLRKFKAKIAKYDLVLVAHAKNYRKNYKDVGRVMVAMAMGIPVLATPCIEANRVFSEAGHPELIVRTPDEFKKAYRMLKPLAVRQKITDDLFEYAHNNWRPDQASQKLVEVFERVVKCSG